MKDKLVPLHAGIRLPHYQGVLHLQLDLVHEALNWLTAIRYGSYDQILALKGEFGVQKAGKEERGQQNVLGVSQGRQEVTMVPSCVLLGDLLGTYWVLWRERRRVRRGSKAHEPAP